MSTNKLSPHAAALLTGVLDAGGTRDWWPDRSDAAAIRALENRGLIVFDDNASRREPRPHGLSYKLTETGVIAARMAKGR